MQSQSPPDNEIPAAPPTLEAALGFDASDLAANRAGEISPAQRAQLRRNWRRGVWISLAVLAIGILAASVCIFLGGRYSSPALRLVGLALTFFNAAVVGLGAQAYLRYQGDVARAPVQRLAGPIDRILRMNRGTRSAGYFIRIDGADVRVSKPVFNAFAEGGSYAIYRAPASKQVLSAERLEDAGPPAP